MTFVNSLFGMLLVGVGRFATGTSTCSATVTRGHACTKTAVSATLKAASPDECCALCAARQRVVYKSSSCVQWTFKGGHECLLTNLSQPLHSHSGATCGIMGATPSPSPAPAPVPTPPSPSPSPLPPSTGLHGPDPSFHTIPVVSHSFYGKKKTEPWPRPPALLANLSKFRLVVIEKFEGPCWDHCFIHRMPDKCVPSCDVARYQLGTARALKSINPNISTIIYVNSVMLFPMYSYVQQFWSDEALLLRDTKTGKIGHIQNDAGLGNLTVPDWGLPQAVDLMVATVVNLTSGERGRGAFDGIFSDKAVKDAKHNTVCNHGCIDLDPDTATAWTTGHQSLMRQEQHALGGGLNMRKAGSLHNDSSVDGHNISAYTEFAPTLDDAAKLATLSEQVGPYGTVFAYAGKSCDESTIACYLVGVRPGVFLQCESWQEQFGYALGNPTTPAATVEGKVWTRVFESGTVAQFDGENNKGTVRWSSTKAIL